MYLVGGGFMFRGKVELHIDSTVDISALERQ